MNDKNFIEELRQKRNEYGVSQRRFAVACGIMHISDKRSPFPASAV